MKISGLILAAGLSGRMNSFKPILKINNKPLIQIVAEKLLFVCDEVLIVTGYNHNLVEEAVNKFNRVKFVYNKNYQQGMFTSLKRGLNEVKNSDWVLYHFVDQPSLPVEFYKEFISQINNNFNWIQPAFNEMKGHPILLHYSLSKIILDESDSGSLKSIGRDQKVKKKIWNCDYPQVLEDVDTKEEFEKINSN